MRNLVSQAHILTVIIVVMIKSSQAGDSTAQLIAALRSTIERNERAILYSVDYAVITSEAKAFGGRVRARSQARTVVTLSGRDPQIPATLAALKPTWVCISPEYVKICFGGTLFDFGFLVFNDGIGGYGTKCLGPGLWFYSQDGRVAPP